MQRQNSHFFGVRFERRKVDKKSKPTRKLKHANSILEYFEHFCQMTSKSIHIISSYSVSKLRRFFETQCIEIHVVQVVLTNARRDFLGEPPNFYGRQNCDFGRNVQQGSELVTYYSTTWGNMGNRKQSLSFSIALYLLQFGGGRLNSHGETLAQLKVG